MRTAGPRDRRRREPSSGRSRSDPARGRRAQGAPMGRILCRSRHTRCRKGSVRGQHAHAAAELVDRMRLDGPRLEVGLRKGGVSARGVVHACVGGRRRTESLNRTKSVGRARGLGLAPSGQTRVARLGLGERGDNRAALFKPGLPGHDLVHRALEGIPLKQSQNSRLRSETRARFGQSVLVTRLHFRLPREDCAQSHRRGRRRGRVTAAVHANKNIASAASAPRTARGRQPDRA